MVPNLDISGAGLKDVLHLIFFFAEDLHSRCVACAGFALYLLVRILCSSSAGWVLRFVQLAVLFLSFFSFLFLLT